MNPLAQERCCPQAPGTPALSSDESRHLLTALSGWTIEEGRLSKRFKGRDYAETLWRVNAIAWLAQREDHHPELIVGYDRLEVRLVTHSVGGLSRNDFILAAKIDQLLSADEKSA